MKPGEENFRLAVNLQDRNLVNVNGNSTNTATQGDVRFVTQFERGVIENWSIAGGLFSLPFTDHRRNYLSLGLRTAVEGFATRVDVAANDDGGVTGEISAQGFLGAINLFARHGQFFDFVSERVDGSPEDTLRARSQARADSVIPIGQAVRLPVTFQVEHELRDSGSHELDVSNRLSSGYRRLSATNNLSFNLRSGGNTNRSERANGSLLVNYRMRSLLFRSEMAYDLYPDAEVTNLALTTDWDINKDLSARTTISHRVGDSRTEVTAGLNKRFKSFAMGVDVSANDEREYFAGLSVTLSLGRDPWSGSWTASPNRRAYHGTVAARVFVDEDRNGHFDEGDTPLTDVDFLTNHRRARVRTDEDGTAVIQDLPIYQNVNIAVARNSIDDPYLVPAFDGVGVPSRPGAVAVLDFPMLRTGEVDGMVRLKRDDAEKGLGDVQMELVDQNGDVVATTKTEFDGFYLFQLVPLGRHVVRLSPKQLQRLSLEGTPQQNVELTVDEPVFNGVDFMVARVVRKAATTSK